MSTSSLVWAPHRTQSLINFFNMPTDTEASVNRNCATNNLAHLVPVTSDDLGAASIATNLLVVMAWMKHCRTYEFPVLSSCCKLAKGERSG